MNEFKQKPVLGLIAQSVAALLVVSCVVCLVGCTTSRRVDKVDYYDKAVCGDELFVFAVRERGRDYTTWGPDPRSSWKKDRTEVYRLTYVLDGGKVGQIIEPTIEKIVDVEEDYNFKMEPYLPPDSYEIRETEKYGISWRYTDELYSLTVDLYSVLSNELTVAEINRAAELGYPVPLTKRYYETPTFKMMWSAEQEYGPTYVAYCVTSEKIYVFPSNVGIDLHLIFSPNGCVYFSESHAAKNPQRKKPAILKWNPESGLAERWFLDLPGKSTLSRVMKAGDE